MLAILKMILYSIGSQ